MSKKALAKAIKIVGSQSELARRIKAPQQSISRWLNETRKGVPAEYAAAIENATGGKVKRSQLRPDVFT